MGIHRTKQGTRSTPQVNEAWEHKWADRLNLGILVLQFCFVFFTLCSITKKMKQLQKTVSAV